MVDEKGLSVNKLIGTINEIASVSGYRSSVKKQFCSLARKLKLLTPMFEEIKDSKEPLSHDSAQSLAAFAQALDSAKDFLRFGSQGSKSYLVLKREHIMDRFHEMTANLEKALDGILEHQLDISDEVREQVELVLSQFRRAKRRVDLQDEEVYEDLLSLYNNTDDPNTDSDILKRVTENLQLVTIKDLKEESLALHDMVVSSSGDNTHESIEKMCLLLKKIKGFVLAEDPNLESCGLEQRHSAGSSSQTSVDGSQKSILIPNDFRCPISLELMKDPVIVSTGQTYERSCIEKWIKAGHRRCPKTQQTLISTILTPNYVLRSLIAQWCEANGLEPPKRPAAASHPGKSMSLCTMLERSKIKSLLSTLSVYNPEDQCAAAGELRLLAKRNADNRVAIAEAGAIPLLVSLLSSTTDPRTQEHAVTALLNLSICENNKGAIVYAGAVPAIVSVLLNGSMEARENAAATLFSLSVVDENKVTIGNSGAIPLLVALLNEGTQRGKKDAATALFNLCIFQGNKGKAVRAGVVPILMRLLTEQGEGMMDEALAILAILASHPDGKVAIAAVQDAIPVLVDVILNGSPRNRENATAVMVHLCHGDQCNLAAAKALGVMGPLVEMAHFGTDRGKRKAVQLIERLNRFVEQQKHAQAAAQHGNVPNVPVLLQRTSSTVQFSAAATGNI